MEIEEMYNVLDSFVPGFGKRNNPDTNNAVFIANELFNLGLSLSGEERAVKESRVSTCMVC